MIATNSNATIPAASLCCLISETMYSALDAGGCRVGDVGEAPEAAVGVGPRTSDAKNIGAPFPRVLWCRLLALHSAITIQFSVKLPVLS